MNRIDIAKIFWQLGEVNKLKHENDKLNFFKHQISTALFASKLFKSMSKYLGDFEDELNGHAE